MNSLAEFYENCLQACSDAGIPSWGVHLLEGALIVLVVQGVM